MTDIELVIKIPEVLYEYCKNYDALTSSRICGAIANSTPLPKGHGRLIDVSDIEWAKHLEERNHIDYEVVDWDEITDAPTIIEADKAESEE